MPSRIELAHAVMVSRLKKDGLLIIQQLDPRKADLWHMATGVSGEAGELLDCVKKNVAYDKPLDLENLTEELGDLEFYLQGLRSITGISREDCLKHNLQKLLTGKNARYAEGIYSDAQAQTRADKDGQNVTNN